jgi:hypothetical protein
VAKTSETVEVRRVKVGTRYLVYQRERVLCGKPGCSRLHGPYWYAYWARKGRQVSRYIGLKFHRLTEEQVRATERSNERKAQRAAAKRLSQRTIAAAEELIR